MLTVVWSTKKELFLINAITHHHHEFIQLQVALHYAAAKTCHCAYQASWVGIHQVMTLLTKWGVS